MLLKEIRGNPKGKYLQLTSDEFKQNNIFYSPRKGLITLPIITTLPGEGDFLMLDLSNLNFGELCTDCRKRLFIRKGKTAIQFIRASLTSRVLENRMSEGYKILKFF